MTKEDLGPGGDLTQHCHCVLKSEKRQFFVTFTGKLTQVLFSKPIVAQH